ncbi:MAG TPA: lipoate--protein ligase family protein [Pirellulales bacterium]
MQLLDLTLESAAENLALDEALLDSAESDLRSAESTASDEGEILRLWEPRELMVVAGSSSHLADEVHLDSCRRRNIPVVRRASGGATIVTGNGCLMYAVVLSYRLRPQLRPINLAHDFVLTTIAAALNQTLITRGQPLVSPTAASSLRIARAGTSDLVLDDKKFSGNSLRCKRNHFLYHGTLLYDFPLHEIAALLKMPTRQPKYRNARPHADFIINLPLTLSQLRAALTNAFDAHFSTIAWPRGITNQLITEKYSRLNWNERM